MTAAKLPNKSNRLPLRVPPTTSHAQPGALVVRLPFEPLLDPFDVPPKSSPPGKSRPGAEPPPPGMPVPI
jgi:hypothetical protein